MENLKEIEMAKICLAEVEDEVFKKVDCDSKSVTHIAKSKSKRKPSKYNIFMGKCVKGKTGEIKTRFKACVMEWKKR